MRIHHRLSACLQAALADEILAYYEVSYRLNNPDDEDERLDKSDDEDGRLRAHHQDHNEFSFVTYTR